MAKGMWCICSNGSDNNQTSEFNYTAADALVDAKWATADTSKQIIASDGSILQVIYGVLYSTATVNGGIVTGGTVSATTGTLNGVPAPPENSVKVLTIVATGNDNVPCNSRTLIIEGLAGAGTMTGIAGGREGQQLTLIINVAQNMGLITNSASSAAGNQFEVTMSTDPTTTGIGSFQLVYSTAKAGWVQYAMNA